MNNVISIESLTKTYGTVNAVNNLNLQISQGEIFGFLGPNGAGKTTTIRMLTGFVRPTTGNSLILGMNSWHDSVDIKTQIGLLPDSPNLYSNMTGTEFLNYMSALQRVHFPEIRQSLCERLEFSAVDLNRSIKQYSHGMRQKLAIIQSLQHDPIIVIMDEPTEALDPLMQQVLFDLIVECKSRERTVFFSSHNLTDVEKLCDRVGIIKKGDLIAVKTVNELKKHKLRHLDVSLKNDASQETFDIPGIVKRFKDGNRMKLVFKGDINLLIKELSKLDLDDMILEPPRLEDIFLDYYRPNDSNDELT